MIDAFVPPQRMRAVIFSAQPSAGHPFVDQPGVLSGAEMLRAVVPARESIVVERAATMLKPRLDAGSRRLKQFELHGPAGLLLHHRRPRPDPAAADEIANTDFDDVAAAQLAVDGKVEQGPCHAAVAHGPARSGSPTPAAASAPAWHRPCVRHSTGAALGPPGRMLNVPLIELSFRPNWPAGACST
jgi:hypothetical protein